MNLSEISGRESAIFSATAATAAVSAASRFRNLRLAGTLANSSSTITDVPSGQPASSTETGFPALNSMIIPVGLFFVRVIMRIFDTLDIAASASPRNPRVAIPSRSAAQLILLVA